MLLAADIGGTWARLLALSDGDGQILASATYASSDFSSLAEVINRFRRQHDLPGFAAACLGLPGPVSGRRVCLTNLPWQVDADTLEHACAIGQVQLVNDFQAAACGVDTFTADQLLVLNQGQPEPYGLRLVAGAGTGLGVAPVFFCQGRHVPVASEGGHMDFAPADDIQQDLLRWLWQQWKHVSYERVLSGPGLELLYGFFAGAAHPEQAVRIAAAEITARAAAGDPVAGQTLVAFVAIYGNYLGNLALLWPARSGIYLVGGVSRHIRHWLQQPAFLQAMQAKGRMRELVASLPVYLVTGAEPGLHGAAIMVRQLVNSQAGGL